MKSNTQSPSDLVIKYSVKSFQVMHFYIKEPSQEIKTNFQIDKYITELSFDNSFDVEKHIIVINLSINNHYVLNGKKEELLGISLNAIFNFENIEIFYDKEKNALRIPDEFISNIIGIIYSTARGIIFDKTLGSFLNQFILPIMDTNALIEHIKNINNHKSVNK